MNNHASGLLSFQREFMALFLSVILAKLARSAMKMTQREGKEFVFLFKVEGNFLSLQMKE